MRITELLVMGAVLICLMSGILSGFRRSIELSETAIYAERKAMCMVFVSGSFRATCEGKGFDSLKDWQKSCCAMYNLDYIGFGEADDFMETSINTDDVIPTLYYGTWTGPYGSGEVYFRLNF